MSFATTSAVAPPPPLVGLPSVLLGQLLVEYVEDPGPLARLVDVALGAPLAAAVRAACLAALAETPMRASRAMGDPQLVWARARCKRVVLRMYPDMPCVRMPNNVHGRARLLNGRLPHSDDARAAVVLQSSHLHAPLNGGGGNDGGIVTSALTFEWRHEGRLHRRRASSSSSSSVAAAAAAAAADLPAVIVVVTPFGESNVPMLCEWWTDGQRHRGGGRPAVIHADGRFEWWVHGVQHRGGCMRPRPAVVMRGGRREWIVAGRRHRTGGLPAVVDGREQQWWVDGQLHRADGGPALVGPTGRRRAWYENGVPHRAGGLPAVEDDDAGNRAWYENGVPHRAGGKPAVVRRAVGGTVTVEWWVHGRRHRDRGRPAVLVVRCTHTVGRFSPRDQQNVRTKRATMQYWTNGEQQSSACEESQRVWRCPALIQPFHVRRH